MEILWGILLFFIALPGLPISIPALIVMDKLSGPSYGTSGGLGCAFLLGLASGIIGWIVVLAFLLGHFVF